MSYRPFITGGVVVEVPKEEYEDLVRESTRLAVLMRLMKERDYISTGEVLAILGVSENENKEGDAENV